MRQTHRPGEKLFVDFAGATMPIVDPATGEVRDAAVFVAALGASNFAYAEVVESQAPRHWLDAHVRALEFLGGALKVLVPDYVEVELQGADLRAANLRAVCLRGANLRGASLRGVTLRKVDLREADLREADLREASAQEADLTMARLRGARLDGSNFSKAKFLRADFRDAMIGSANLSGADLRGVCFTGADLNRANLSGVDLREAVLATNLETADLRGADLRKAGLIGTNLRGANLSRANLSGAILCGANLSTTNLSEIDLSGTEMTEVNLTSANISGAVLDRAEVSELLLLDVCVTPFIRSEIKHMGPSHVDYRSVVASIGEPGLPEFLRRTGMPDVFVEFMIDCARGLNPNLYTNLLQAIFISYGGPDESFAEKLNAALEAQGVRTFLFKKHAIPGEKLHRVMRNGVSNHDRVILICSRASLERPGVLNELEETLAREARDGGGGDTLLLPVRLDDYVINGWNPTRTDLATAVRDRVIADFREHWDPDKFKSEMALLLKALKRRRP